MSSVIVGRRLLQFTISLLLLLLIPMYLPCVAIIPCTYCFHIEIILESQKWQWLENMTVGKMRCTVPISNVQDKPMFFFRTRPYFNHAQCCFTFQMVTWSIQSVIQVTWESHCVAKHPWSSIHTWRVIKSKSSHTVHLIGKNDPNICVLTFW